MGTPEQPDPGRMTCASSLYGECASRINQGRVLIGRRALIGGALALPVAAQARGWGEEDVLTRAIAARGGRALLTRVKALNWTGEAKIVVAADRTITVGVKSRVEPFVRSHSEYWQPGQADSTRIMAIEPDTGWVEMGGKRTTLPPAQAEHERQQYAIYGYMLLALAPAEVRNGAIVTQRAGLPQMRFLSGGETGAIWLGTYVIDSPEGGEKIEEQIIFTGEHIDQGVHWPRTIDITQNQKPFFTLTIDSFSVELT